MLFDAWLQTARSRPGELALVDLASARRWTFRQLADEAEALPSADGPVFPSGASAGFIFDVLRAWRGGQILCPLDQGQPFPNLADAPIPKGCVHLKTTSGVTGAPRLIAFTGPQLAADARHIVATMGLRPEWPNLGVISLAHSYGFSNLVLPLLLHGIPLALVPTRLPEALRHAGAQFPALTLPGVPALWRVWHEAGAIPSSIRLALTAGAAFPAALERDIFARSGLKVRNFYGASECGGICFDNSPTPRDSDEDVGAPMHDVQLTTDADGRLVVLSDAVGLTYWPSPDPALAAGQFRAGDRVEIRAGRVFLQGRHTDTINVAGQKVAPETIEHVIRQFPGVRECLVFGASDQGAARAENIVAFVVPAEGLELPALKRFVAEKLPSWQAPRHWQLVPSLSDPVRGKVSRALWRDRFLHGHQL